MGICVSCQATSVATANVISEDGSLHQYSYPLPVSYLLSNHPSSFICNSDDMEFDDVVSAVRHDHQLQPGHLYFILPLSKLSRPLHPQEMAALAVKANAALLNASHKCACRNKGRVSFFRSGDKSVKVADDAVGVTKMTSTGNQNSGSRNRNRINNNGVNRNLASKLTPIPE